MSHTWWHTLRGQRTTLYYSSFLCTLALWEDIDRGFVVHWSHLGQYARIHGADVAQVCLFWRSQDTLGEFSPALRLSNSLTRPSLTSQDALLEDNILWRLHRGIVHRGGVDGERCLARVVSQQVVVSTRWTERHISVSVKLPLVLCPSPPPPPTPTTNPSM